MIYLASKSTARLRILKDAGLGVQTIASHFDEGEAQQELAKLSPPALSLALASGKAQHVTTAGFSALVIGADQTLEHDGETLHKPRSLLEAEAQLLRLRGDVHQLHSSVACCQDGKILWSFTDSAELQMRDFSSAFMRRYLQDEGDNVLQTVGCYRLEGLGAQLFRRIAGDYFTILGLPLLPLLDFLRSHGELQT